jgi:putative methionine-R-sulfoxide reductase with GAF domain
VLAPRDGDLLGALEVQGADSRPFDALDAGLLERCAEALLPLWQP